MHGWVNSQRELKYPSEMISSIFLNIQLFLSVLSVFNSGNSGTFILVTDILLGYSRENPFFFFSPF